MRILRNIFIALAYLLGLIALIVAIVTEDNIGLIFALASIGFTLLALLLAGRMKRKFIRIPLIIGVLGVVLSYAMPALFPKKLEEGGIQSIVEQEQQKTEEDLSEFIQELDSMEQVSGAESGAQPAESQAPATKNQTDQSDVFVPLVAE